MNEKKIFCDLDGTVARFYENRATCLEDMYGVGFFKYLNPYMSMIYSIKSLISLGFKVYPCTACVTEHSKDEKREWLHALLPEIPEDNYILCEVGQNKADVVKGLGFDNFANCCLIDDYTRNLNDWTAAGGRSIKFRNELNGTNGTWSGPSIYWNSSASEIVAEVINILQN